MAFLLEASTAAGARGVTTGQLVDRVSVAFGVPMATSKEREALRFTVRSRMRELRDLHGLVVAECQAGVGKAAENVWRRVAPMSLEELRLDAAARGAAPAEALDEHSTYSNALRGEVAGERVGDAGR